MIYRKINDKTILEEVCIKAYKDYSDEAITLLSLGNMSAGDLVQKICENAIKSDKIDAEMTSFGSKELLLSYKLDGEEICIDFLNTTSDVESEWLQVSLNSEVIIDSILLGTDLATTALGAFLRSNSKYKNVEEYYREYYSIKVLSTALIERLAEKEFSAYSLFGHNEPITAEHSNPTVDKQLKYIPADNLRGLLTNFDVFVDECGKDKTFSDFMKVASESGALVFKPYIKDNSHGNPTLVLKYNRFVHLFRGYHYQCSYTADGIGEYASAGIRIDSISQIFGKELRESRLLKILYYMNLIACCKGISAFDKLLKKNPELVDEFMKLSTKSIFRDYDITYTKDLLGILNFTSDSMPYGENYFARTGNIQLPEPAEVFRVPLNITTDMCRIKVYDSNEIGIELWFDEKVQEVLFVLPDWKDGLSMEEIESLADWEDMDTESYTNMMTSKIYEAFEVYCSLVNFALNTCGFVTNFMVTYPTDEVRDSRLRALNRVDVKEFNSLSDIYNK